MLESSVGDGPFLPSGLTATVSVTEGALLEVNAGA
jgi:hypothetical protein